ncbi:hypothetical protein HYC85_024329 [Camellia sinensis]|uniref:Uncharacterized protein n=1 Tax=Camellia sinensis TaxID=4442 RepID=A0A7J7G7T5_CAMSI|nr:hypothetical protein HYC85_024329 [Camellia sinensis]
MAVLSVTSTHSHSSLFLSPPPPPPPPPHSSPKIYGCLSFSTILIPLPTLKPSSFSQRFSINGNWDSRRNRFRANSSDPERDFQNPPTQISQENDEISKIRRKRKKIAIEYRTIGEDTGWWCHNVVEDTVWWCHNGVEDTGWRCQTAVEDSLWGHVGPL